MKNYLFYVFPTRFFKECIHKLGDKAWTLNVKYIDMVAPNVHNLMLAHFFFEITCLFLKAMFLSETLSICALKPAFCSLKKPVFWGIIHCTQMRAVQNEKEARGGLLFHPIPPVLCSVNCYGNVFNFSFSDSLEATLRYENKHQLQQW